MEKTREEMITTGLTAIIFVALAVGGGLLADSYSRWEARRPAEKTFTFDAPKGADMRLADGPLPAPSAADKTVALAAAGDLLAMAAALPARDAAGAPTLRVRLGIENERPVASYVLEDVDAVGRGTGRFFSARSCVRPFEPFGTASNFRAGRIVARGGNRFAVEKRTMPCSDASLAWRAVIGFVLAAAASVFLIRGAWRRAG